MKIQVLAVLAAKVVAGLIRLPFRLSKTMTKGITIAVLVAATILAGHSVSAQLTPPAPSQPLGSLKGVPIPEPSNLTDFIRDRTAAIRLGKSLFWDMQVGSDGLMSCASCHFHAGTDTRSKNQVHPGPDITFNTGGRPNYQLTAADYPFHKLSDPNNRSSVVSDSNDVAGSQGVNLTRFNDIVPGNAQDNVTIVPDPVFKLKDRNNQDVNVRQVTGRNSPSTINAVFNFRNFWDGLAQNEFNGVNPFGSRDAQAHVYKAPSQQTVQLTKVSINNASLASQAVGPPLSQVEESATGRIFPEVGQKFATFKAKKLPRETGKKLRALKPLAKQIVHPDDSVLGTYTQAPLQGLRYRSYEDMVKDAFKREWWDAQKVIRINDDRSESVIPKPNRGLATNEYQLMDYNFPLIMGLSIQMYESTLVSDSSPFDQYMDGRNPNALTPEQKLGKELFEGKAKCVNCHGGAEFTNASVRNVRNQKIERMVMGDNGVAVYDNGFYNIGVRPTQEDLGVGGSDRFGNPLSFTKYAQRQVAQGQISAPIVKSAPGEDIPDAPLDPNERAAVNGAFKTPTLRNIAMTAPYFHNGGQLTLRQVVDFYNRGGDFHEQNINDLDADIQNLELNDQEKDALVAFLKSLTDDRVRFEKAPFDHPQLFITNGHPKDPQGNDSTVINDGFGQATVNMLEIPAVGRNGASSARQNFLPS